MAFASSERGANPKGPANQALPHPAPGTPSEVDKPLNALAPRRKPPACVSTGPTQRSANRKTEKPCTYRSVQLSTVKLSPMPDYFAVNRANWDKRVAIHTAADSSTYDLSAFRRTRDSLDVITRAELPDVRGLRVLHLQCHFGMDTLSLAARGAHVTGVDFSPAAIAQGRALAAELGLAARFVESDVYGLPAVLDETFDLVFTTWGVLTWLPDLDRWADTVRAMLRPGGRLFLLETHPTLYLMDFDEHRMAFDYFRRAEPYYEEHTGSYAATDHPTLIQEYFWQHGLAEILSPLLARDFTLTRFAEFDFLPYDCFPNLRERAPGEYVYEPVPGVRLPHAFLYAAVRG